MNLPIYLKDTILQVLHVFLSFKATNSLEMRGRGRDHLSRVQSGFNYVLRVALALELNEAI